MMFVIKIQKVVLKICDILNFIIKILNSKDLLFINYFDLLYHKINQKIFKNYNLDNIIYNL